MKNRFHFIPRLLTGIIAVSLWLPASATVEEAMPLNNTPTNTASDQKASTSTQPQALIPTPPPIDAKGYILMDAHSGVILAGKNIDAKMAPASLTKLMTLYQIAAALKANRLHLEDKVTISERAWRTGGSKMFIKVGDQVPATDLIQGIAVVSGNDACVAMAEHLAGSEESFADLMSKSATKLGMNNTHYTDSNGLPDPQLYTTSRDLAILARAIITDYPEYYHWYSQKWFEYRGIKQPNRDSLLWRDPAVDGMKTGHTSDAGYCLVSSAQRNGMRLISVVMGSSSSRARANGSLALLNYGFRFYESKKLFSANTTIKQPRVWFGKNKYQLLGLTQDLYVTLPVGKSGNLQATITMADKIKAPVKKGDSFGTITIKQDDKELLSRPLVALEDNPKGGAFSRMFDRIAVLFYGIFHRFA
jgi:D-alanyl-D-alanine carboxypeptidase (penicillin-binding protein 5/6)